MLTLVTIGYSPYSERAKWALDHHGVDYRVREFLPMISDLGMRLRFGADFTVPALYGDGVRLGDSYAIAGYADKGKGELFPAGSEERIRELHALSEEALHLGRALLVAATARSDGALRENLVILPKPVRPYLMPLARQGLQYFRKHFGLDDAQEAANREKLRGLLAKASEAVKSGGGYAVGGRFSFADITLAVMLQFVSPPRAPFVKVGPAIRDAMTQKELASQFAELIQWRDGLYERHRAGKTRAQSV